MATTTEPRRRGAPKLPPDVDLGRLADALAGARKSLRGFRDERLDAVRQLAGAHYGEGGVQYELPVNLLNLYVSVMAKALAPREPRALLATADPAARPAVAAAEKWLNAEFGRANLTDAIQRAVVDALVCVGVAKVALAGPGDAATAGWGLSAGTPFVETISLDDFVCDMHARRFEECSFVGHRYRVPLAVAAAMYRRKRGDELVAEPPTDYTETGDERVGALQRGAAADKDEFEEYVTCWEIYLPRHRLVLTLLDDPHDGIDPERGLLAVQRWVGPPAGPYHFLGLGAPLPDNLLPNAPVPHLKALHKAVNACYRKLIADTLRWKNILPVGSKDAEDGRKITEANNGDAVVIDAPADRLREVAFGGPGAGVLQMAMHLKDLFSWLAGNLDIIAGLAPQSKTASQDKMLDQNSARTVGDMAAAVVGFMDRIFRALFWYAWKHPQKVMETTGEVDGLPELAWKRAVYPAGSVDEAGRPRRLRRDGPVPEVRVDPYSLPHASPQARLAFLDGVVQQMTPMLQLLAQQGVMFDAKKYVELKARYGNEPEVAEVFRFDQPVPGPEGGGGDGAGMPAQTSREYIRRSLGGESAGAKANALETAAAADGGANFNGPLGS